METAPVRPKRAGGHFGEHFKTAHDAPLMRPPLIHTANQSLENFPFHTPPFASVRTSSVTSSTTTIPPPVLLPGDRRSVYPHIPLPLQKPLFAPDAELHLDVTSSLEDLKKISLWKARPTWLQRIIQFTGYTLIACLLYFVFIGWPLWHGIVYSFWFVYKTNLILQAGFVLFIGVAMVFAVFPLLVNYEPIYDPNEKDSHQNQIKARDVSLIIPCHNSGAAIGATLEAALKTFPRENIYVVDNGNTPAPTDNTEEICNGYGVRYIWSSLGSKILAQFIGCHAAYGCRYTLLIDDDCLLPENFPIRTERIRSGHENGRTKCVGYSISSVGPDGSKGSYCQQAQDLEYKLSGLKRYFAGMWGSAVFPHGAIMLWDRRFLLKCFQYHPGFTISEDWFLGHVCRTLGGRITFCTEVFVKTETPANLRSSSSGGRGGYGEMTVMKQRMKRWNFFLVSRMWYNVKYILFSWKLGIYELGTKMWIFQEIYETLLLLSFPIVFPVSLAIRPAFTIGISLAVTGMYFVLAVALNEVHLRRKKAQVNRKVVLFYYMPYKLFLRLVNVFSVYLAIYEYARYFRTSHPKIMENGKAMEIVLSLSEQDSSSRSGSSENLGSEDRHGSRHRAFSV